ncbi:AAA family ATPase [Anaerotignum sp.]
MEYPDVLSRFESVKMSGTDKAVCKCPCHDDRKASLSIDKSGDKILFHCFAGCKTEDILVKVGLTFADISNSTDQQKGYLEKLEAQKGETVSAVYKYTDESGHYLYEKIRFHDKDMTIGVYDQQKEAFSFGLQGRNRTLFHLPSLIDVISKGSRVFYVEGEKDVLTLEKLGFAATTAGSVNDWKPEYAPYFKGADVVILPDNDEPGLTLASKVYKDLEGTAAKILIVKTSSAPKGDVTDYIEEGHTKEDLLRLIDETEAAVSSQNQDKNGCSLEMTTMETAEEKSPEWLITDYIPKRSITAIAGDGGSGKTTVWCEIAASISSGKPSFLVKNLVPESFQSGEGQRVLFFSAEDSFEYTLRRRLRKNGANLSNIFSIDISDDRFQHIRFDSDFLEKLVEKYRPALLIFDPLQAFVPPNIKMGDRNAMRTCMRPLIGLGEKYDCSSLIVVHSNKQSGLWGRKRIADSADIWDISRSVLMVGETKEKGIRYISHEKCNYGALGDTVLFSLDNEKVTFREYTDRKDKDFVTEFDYTVRQAPQREEAIEFILDFLKDGEKEVAELDATANAMNISKNALKNAKAFLRKNQKIEDRSEGYGKNKVFFISLTG